MEDLDFTKEIKNNFHRIWSSYVEEMSNITFNLQIKIEKIN